MKAAFIKMLISAAIQACIKTYWWIEIWIDDTFSKRIQTVLTEHACIFSLALDISEVQDKWIVICIDNNFF